MDKQRVGDTVENLHDSFTVNGADYWYSIPNHTVRNYENKLAQGATPSGQLRSVAPAVLGAATLYVVAGLYEQSWALAVIVAELLVLCGLAFARRRAAVPA